VHQFASELPECGDADSSIGGSKVRSEARYVA